MPVGFRALSLDGTEIWGSNDSAVKIFGIVDILGSNGNGSLSDARFTLFAGNTPFVAVLEENSDFEEGPTFSFSGNTLSWVYGDRPRTNVKIMYGIT